MVPCEKDGREMVERSSLRVRVPAARRTVVLVAVAGLVAVMVGAAPALAQAGDVRIKPPGAALLLLVAALTVFKEM